MRRSKERSGRSPEVVSSAAHQRVQDTRAGIRIRGARRIQVRAIIEEKFAALGQELARELPLALAGGARVREDGDSGLAQAGRDVLAGFGGPAEDAHARPGLGEHEGQCRGLRLQDEGEPHAPARNQGCQGTCRRLGDGHVGARPLDAPLVAGARDGAPVGGDDRAEGASGCQDRDSARAWGPRPPRARRRPGARPGCPRRSPVGARGHRTRAAGRRASGHPPRRNAPR